MTTIGASGPPASSMNFRKSSGPIEPPPTTNTEPLTGPVLMAEPLRPPAVAQAATDPKAMPSLMSPMERMRYVASRARSVQISRMRLLGLPLLLLPASVLCQEADVIIRNATRIWTGDSTNPRAEAIAIRGERILYVGSNAGADAHRTARTRVIDATGRMVTPGFIDDHTHFAQAGGLLIGANLLDVSTPGPFAARVKAAVRRVNPTRDDTPNVFVGHAPRPGWLTGG